MNNDNERSEPALVTLLELHRHSACKVVRDFAAVEPPDHRGSERVVAKRSISEGHLEARSRVYHRPERDAMVTMVSRLNAHDCQHLRPASYEVDSPFCPFLRHNHISATYFSYHPAAQMVADWGRVTLIRHLN